MEFYREIFQNIRKDKGHSRKAVSLLSGLSEHSLRAWEQGVRKPKEDDIRILAKLYDLSVSDISDLYDQFQHNNNYQSTHDENWNKIVSRDFSYIRALEDNITSHYENMIKLPRFLEEVSIKIHAILTAVDIPIYVKDSKGCFLTANKSFYQAVRLNFSKAINGLTENDIENFHNKKAKDNYHEDINLLATKKSINIESRSFFGKNNITMRTLKHVILDEKKKPIGLVATFVDITKLKKQQLVLDLFHDTLIGNDHYGIIFKEILPDGKEKYIEFNSKAEEILGFKQRDFQQNPSLIRNTIHPEDRYRVLDSSNAAKKELKAWSGEYRIKTKDTSTKWVRELISFYHNKEENRDFYVIHLSDITETKQQIHEIEAFKLRLNSVDIVVYNCQETVNRLDSSCGHSKFEFEYVNEKASKKLLELTEKQFKNNDWIKHITKDGLNHFNKITREQNNPRIFIGQYQKPISKKMIWIKVTTYFSFNTPDGCRKHYGFIEDITEQKQKDKKIVRFQKLLDHNKHSAFWHKEENCKIHNYVNPAYDSIYTYPIESFQIAPEFWFDIIVDEDRTRIKNRVDKIKKNHIDDIYDYRINTSDGKIKHLETSITWDQDIDTGNWYYLGETRDLTDEKNKTDEIELLKHCIDNNSTGILVYDESTNKILYMNDRCCEIYEKNVNNYLNMEREVLFSPESYGNKKVLEQLNTNAFPGDTPFVAIYSKIINGKMKYIKTKRTKLQYSGRKCVIVNVEDITEEKEQEKGLQLFKNLFDNNTHSAIWIRKKAEKQFIYVNSAFDKIFECPSTQFLKSSQILFDMIHPDDRDRIKKQNEQIRTYHLNKTLKYRIVTKDKKVKYLETKINWKKDEYTGEMFYLGITNDVTDLKMLLNCFDDINIGVAIYNPSIKRCLYVNKKICEIFEKTKADYEKYTLDELNDTFYTDVTNKKQLVSDIFITTDKTVYSPIKITINDKTKYIKTKYNWTTYNDQRCIAINVEEVTV